MQLPLFALAPRSEPSRLLDVVIQTPAAVIDLANDC
jgi:hypothetical protein